MCAKQEVSGLSPKVKEYFALDNAAKAWWDTTGHRRYDRQLDIISKEIDSRGKRVLDVATGRGRFSIRYAQNGAAKVTAVDISKGMLEMAEKFARFQGVEACIEFSQADIEVLELERESFHVINCMELYVHLPNPQRVTDRFFEYLLPGGILVANIDIPLTKQWYFHWVNEPLRSLKRRVLAWGLLRPVRAGSWARSGGALYRKLFRQTIDSESRGSLPSPPGPRLATVETIAALERHPDLRLSRPEDAICRMDLNSFLAILGTAGFVIKKVVREGKWYQLPYGYIVIAHKPRPVDIADFGARVDQAA